MEILSNDEKLSYDEKYKKIAAEVALRKSNIAREELKKIVYQNITNNNITGRNDINDIRYFMETKPTKQVRVGGSKGKEGRSDHTAGKKAFKRPCTVGWKSQNQPIKRGGGNRTPL